MEQTSYDSQPEKTGKRLNDLKTMEDFNKFAMEWFEQLEPEKQKEIREKCTFNNKLDLTSVGLIFRYTNTNTEFKYDIYEKFKLYFHVWRDHFHGYNSLIVSTFEDEETLTIEFGDHSFHIEISRNACGPDENEIAVNYFDPECEMFEPRHKYIVDDIKQVSAILQYYGAKHTYELEKLNTEQFKMR